MTFGYLMFELANCSFQSEQKSLESHLETQVPLQVENDPISQLVDSILTLKRLESLIVYTTELEFVEEFYPSSDDEDAYTLSCPEQVCEVKYELELHLEEPQVKELEAAKPRSVLPSGISFIF